MDSLKPWKASSELELVEEIGDITRKMDQVECNYSNSKRRYEKLGSAGIKGSLYQIDLLTLVLLNGLRKVAHWRLSTEDKEAAQLDDLIFEHLPSASTILLQAKNKEDERKEVTYKDLMSVNKNSEFSLPKYFFSYQEVKSKFKVQNVVVCTNLELDKKTKLILKEESVDPGSVLYFEGAKNICYSFSGCSLPELKPSIKVYQAKNVKDKEAIISDEDINDFLKHLKFFSNCLSQKIVDNIIEQTITQIKFSESLNIKTIQTYIQKKMTDWFKEKKGRYLTEVEAKAFFCDVRSNKYCEELKLYDICFKKSNLPLILQTQQSNERKGGDPKQISHIIPDKEYMLNVVKIYQALPSQHKEKALFVNPGETVEVQKEIIEAFAVQHYTILVMVCPNTMEETIAGEMCDRVMKILNAHKYKHVILIAEERNYLATQLKSANNISFEVITDNLTFADLEETTQDEFKRKKLINFQGYTMSLDELFTPSTKDDLDQIVNSELLIKLARGDKTEVGLELPHPDNYYISRSFNRSSQIISEEDLWDSTEITREKVILISDSAGMGKSSVLTSLAISIKTNNPHLWVVRFDLNNYTNIMRTTLEEGRKSVCIIELLNSQETSKLKCEFGKKLFTTQKRLVLMLDGVDEISPAYTELVINLIRDSLEQVNLAKIFVTARPHMFRDLKEILEVQPFAFEPFSKVNQIDFLIEYWTEKLDLQDDTMKQSKCKKYAKALIRKMSVWMNEGDPNYFAGIPLQTRMLAEIFLEANEISDKDHDWEGCKEFLSSNNEEPKLSSKIDLTQLYEMFINIKCGVFIRKSNPSRHPVADEALKLQLKECQKYHRALALQVMFDLDNELRLFTCYNDVEWPVPSALANNFLYRMGIVQVQAKYIEFVHQTIAEYFVTECLLIELERKPVNEELQEFFMRSILISKKFHVIRAFLNCRMPNVLHLMENNFCSYFSQNPISERPLSRYLNVFAKEDCTRILECFIKCLDKEQHEVISETVSNVYLIYDAIYVAVLCGHLNIIKLLLELNETYNKGKDDHKEFLQRTLMVAVECNLEVFEFLLCQVDKDGKNIFGRSALHEAAFTHRFEKVQYLVEVSEVDINIQDNIMGWTALCEAVLMGRLEVVRFLVEDAGADVNVKDNQGRTALHYAASTNASEIVKFLVKDGRAYINVKDNNGETALHRAVFVGKLEIVKFLVEAEADINTKDNKAKTALHTAVNRCELPIIKCLVGAPRADINVKNIDGNTALHAAVHRGALEIVKFLVTEAGADVNIKDNDGNTALHTAVDRSEIEMVKCLVEGTGADVNIRNNYGETAFYRAVYWEELEIVGFLAKEAKADVYIKDSNGNTALHISTKLETVKWLMKETEMDINIKNNDGQTAVHRAVYRDNLDIIECLAEGGADVNITDNYGNTALYTTVYNVSKLETVRCLVKANVDVNIQNNFGLTALHQAINNESFEIVKCLVGEAGARINIFDSDGMTALHKAVYRGELELVKCLVEEAGEDVNTQNDDGNTALHVAVYGGKLNIVKCLVAEPGMDINIVNNAGNTALHLAVQMGDLELAKCLVVEPGVDVNIMNSDGNTALHTAVYRGELEIVTFLVGEVEVDISIKDNNGKTALQIAADQGRWNIVKVLSNPSRWAMFKIKAIRFFGRFPR